MPFIHLPETIAEASLLLAGDVDRQCLAGGGVVVPSLRTGLWSELISLRHVSALRGIVEDPRGVRVNAMTQHAEIALSNLLPGGLSVVRRAAAEIAHPAIRNMATIGGTLCCANPSADFASALLAAAAMVELVGVADKRTLPIDQFMVGNGVTTRRRDEIVSAVILPPDQGTGSAGYARFARVDGDYPVATAAVRLGWNDGQVAEARVAIGGCGPTAYRCASGEAQLVGLTRAAEVPPGIGESYSAAASPVDDLRGSAEYRLLLIPGLLRRAITQALVGGPRAPS